MMIILAKGNCTDNTMADCHDHCILALNRKQNQRKRIKLAHLANL